MVTCFTEGWIQLDSGSCTKCDTFECSEKEHSYCTFPSPLHAWYVEYMYAPSYHAPFPINEYPSLVQLYLAVAERFSLKLFDAARRGMRLGPSGSRLPKEASYKDEFYRAYTDLLQFRGGITTEWPCGGGSLDVFITEQKWGIEFLRNDLNGHLKRFRDGGLYYKSTQDGTLRDWLIIDCGISTPRKKCMDSFSTPLPFQWSISLIQVQTPRSPISCAVFSTRNTPIIVFSIVKTMNSFQNAPYVTCSIAPSWLMIRLSCLN